MDIETLKKMPLAKVGILLKEAYKRPLAEGKGISQWTYDYVIKKVAGDDQEVAKTAKELYDWGTRNPTELEILIASRSPGTAARLAVSRNRRLCAEAEKYVTDKAGDRATLLDYCGHFGIVLGELTKVTMKAAFNDDAYREKGYIKKLEGTKRVVRGFLAQMVNLGRIDQEMTVKQLMEELA